MSITKYLDIDAVAKTPVGEVMQDMDDMGAGTLSMMIQDANDQAVGGLVVIRGEHAERYRQAIEAVSAEIEEED
ncbi:hypothetical protein NYO91_07225 [Arhodomonas aquaeolei]|uniref:hypothetical protein n=1 Tax=Arhodomonas aquaeolei TaxID=2369 RepID=UPI002166FC4D|nr:hypothetical protein [Arhodomonas aquaeolei]MCS4503867.1 hypothetical protein [Arhodomonas aquaeolei]